MSAAAAGTIALANTSAAAANIAAGVRRFAIDLGSEYCPALSWRCARRGAMRFCAPCRSKSLQRGPVEGHAGGVGDVEALKRPLGRDAPQGIGACALGRARAPTFRA